VGGDVAIVGAGPAGLFLARMIGLTRPGTAIEVFERNGPDDADGFGVTLSDRTMRGISRRDPRTHRRITEASVALSGLELRLPGAALRYDGFTVCAISRPVLLTILRQQAQEVGARLHFRHEVRAADLDAGVIALADGAASAHRQARRQAYGTSTRTGSARFIWLGTAADFGDVTVFAFAQTEYGPMAAHCYSYGDGMSTVVVETDEATWRSAGFAPPPGAARGSDEIGEPALGLLTEIFAGHLGGHKLVSNASRWGRFTVVHNERWSHRNTVLLGDAAHTAHFTVGSGTKLALDDGIALASALRAYDDHADAFAAYERERREPVARTQRWAEPSMHWWETYGRRLHLPPAQFGMHFITRTAAVGYLGLRRRCPDRLDDAEAAFRREAGLHSGGPPRNAIGAPLRIGGVRLPNRLVMVGPEQRPAGALRAVPSGLVLVRGNAPAASASQVTGAVAGGVVGTLWPQDTRPSASAASPRFVEVRRPEGPEWTEAADDLVRRAGLLRECADGVLLRAGAAAGPGSAESRWQETLRHASRIRTEAGLAVAVCVPPDWALDLTLEAGADAWPTRIHVALVSGRIDLVAVASPDSSGEFEFGNP